MSVDRELTIERIGRVARLTLNRPARLNALSSELVELLRVWLAEISADREVGAVILAGEGRAFCAGADLSELTHYGPVEFGRYIRALEGVCRQLEQIRQPTVAAVHGVAFGAGCELALACDARVAEPPASFGLPEIKLGLLPGAGGIQRAARLLPLGVVRKLVLTGDPLSAAEAEQHGLAEVVGEGRGADAALALATRLAAGAPLAHAAAKRLLLRGPGFDVESAVELEQGNVVELFASSDREEGIRAFLEKREPGFSGS
jgi:enoyl-CoA hydratase